VFHHTAVYQSNDSGIIQGDGVGPVLWIIMESDFRPLSQLNVMFTCAHYTNVLVPEHNDVSSAVEI